MKISVEISMYPLNEEFIPTIKTFIEKLNQYPEIDVLTNKMSTQIFGDFDVVMDLLKNELKEAFDTDKKIIMVTKFFNGDLLND